jgi:hypothetical protein
LAGVSYWLAGVLVNSADTDEQALVCVSEPPVSTAPLWKYLRGAYGEWTRITETPGHLFLDFERVDLITFVHVALLSQVKASLFTRTNSLTLYLTPEWLEYNVADAAAANLRAQLLQNGLSR